MHRTLAANGPEILYLDLLKRTLTRSLFEDADEILGVSTAGRPHPVWRALNVAGRLARRIGVEIVLKRPYDHRVRQQGLDWPARAETMVGLERLAHLQTCIEAVVRDGVAGDLIEAGVWRGGASIFMRAVLKAHGEAGRTVFVADSFEGLPLPDEKRYPADRGDRHHCQPLLRVDLEEVRTNFDRYGLLDEQVQFLPGWFEETLPSAPIERLSLMRLDGDMYSSTIQTLEALYPRLSRGGFCIVDDYGAVPACRQAVVDYRSAHGISEEMTAVAGGAICWRRAS